MYVLATALSVSVSHESWFCRSKVWNRRTNPTSFPAKFSYDIVDSQMRYSGTAKIMAPEAYFPQELCPKTLDLKNFATVTAKVCDSIVFVLSNMHRRPSMLTTCIYDDFLASRCYVYDMSVDRNALTTLFRFDVDFKWLLKWRSYSTCVIIRDLTVAANWNLALRGRFGTIIIIINQSINQSIINQSIMWICCTFFYSSAGGWQLTIFWLI